jgi:hypothetical protein
MGGAAVKSHQLILLTLPLLVSLSQPAFSMNTTDSATMAPQAVATKIQCTKFIMNDVAATPGGSNNTASSPTGCISVGGGQVVFVGGDAIGNLGTQCPADHPFAQSTSEDWNTFFGFGAANHGLVCCTAPPNKLQTITSWQPPSSSGTCE